MTLTTKINPSQKCVGCGKPLDPTRDTVHFLPRGYLCTPCLDMLLGKGYSVFYGGA